MPPAGAVDAFPTEPDAASGTSTRTYGADENWFERLLGAIVSDDAPVRVETFGRSYGPADSAVVVRLTSPDAIADIASAPGQLGLARAYIAGHLDVEGDITKLMDVRVDVNGLLRHPLWALGALREVGIGKLARAQTHPEAKLSGRRHSVTRDRDAVAYHYEAPTSFFKQLLGPSMAYTCAVFDHDRQDLTVAQLQKYELVCRKLGLQSSSRLLDIGCGWGGFAMHAAEATGCRVVGVTLGTRQVDYARAEIERRSLSDLVEIRQLDYRDVDDGPYDAVVAIGAFEHIGLPRRGPTLFDRAAALLKPGGRYLNQAISSQDGTTSLKSHGFVQRYVFPDGELHELGRTVSAIQAAGLEVRHVENLREHYVLTADCWRANLENDWPKAVESGGAARARIWRLFLAGYRQQLVLGRIGVSQILAVKPNDGQSGFALCEVYRHNRVETAGRARE